MDTLLEAIDVCDVDGFCYGNYTDEEAGTGCTVIVAPEGATGGVDVRGGAPASRETDLLRPENTVDKVHAVCLSGGSVFGLVAAGIGVIFLRELAKRALDLFVGGALGYAQDVIEGFACSHRSSSPVSSAAQRAAAHAFIWH